MSSIMRPPSARRGPARGARMLLAHDATSPPRRDRARAAMRTAPRRTSRGRPRRAVAGAARSGTVGTRCHRGEQLAARVRERGRLVPRGEIAPNDVGHQRDVPTGLAGVRQAAAARCARTPPPHPRTDRRSRRSRPRRRRLHHQTRRPVRDRGERRQRPPPPGNRRAHARAARALASARAARCRPAARSARTASGATTPLAGRRRRACTSTSPRRIGCRPMSHGESLYVAIRSTTLESAPSRTDGGSSAWTGASESSPVGKFTVEPSGARTRTVSRTTSPTVTVSRSTTRPPAP